MEPFTGCVRKNLGSEICMTNICHVWFTAPQFSKTDDGYLQNTSLAYWNAPLSESLQVDLGTKFMKLMHRTGCSMDKSWKYLCGYSWYVCFM